MFMRKDAFFDILEHLPIGVMLGDKDGSVYFANQVAFGYLGIDSDGLMGINIDGLIDDKSGKKEIMLSSKGDQKKTIKLHKIALSDGTYMVNMEDISEVHQLQQEMLKMDRLASVGELTSGIAHEIRNPLAGIKTTAQALSEEMPRSDHRSAYVSRIILEIDRLNKLLLSFFDFAKPKALNLKYCDLKNIIENAVYMVKDTAKDNHVQIIEFYPTTKAVIKADSDMIQQVLMNIFINAIQAVDQGGKMEIHLTERSTFMDITISDNGKGIPGNLRSRIYDPFFTTKPKGIGLGLSISYRIIKMHSGDISFESSPQGTIFTISLQKDLKRG